MKKFFFIIFTVLMSFMASAQSKSLEFYYIAHDRTTPVAALCDRLEEVYQMSLTYEDYAVIFYSCQYITIN